MAQTMIAIFLLFSLILSTADESLGASGQMRDTSRRLYDRVMEEFKQRDYEAALAGFRLFIELHGQSSLAANAQYWIGECQFRMRRYKDALDSFYNVLMYYPLSQKLPASTLKLGQIYAKLGDPEKARMMFDRVIDQYPGSSEAELAQKAVETTIKSEQGSQESD